MDEKTRLFRFIFASTTRIARIGSLKRSSVISLFNVLTLQMKML